MTTPFERALQLGAALVLLAGPAVASSSQVLWYSIVTGTGAPVGYARVEFHDSGEGQERIEYQETTLREQDARPTRVSERTTIRQAADGRTLSIVSDTRVGASLTHVEARPRLGAVDITRESPGGHSATSVAAGPQVQFDGGEKLMATWNPRTTPRLEFDSFNIESLAVEHVVLTPLTGYGGSPDGRIEVMRATYDGLELRGVTRMTLGADHGVLAVTQPLFGTTITVTPADEATALQARVPYKLITTLMMKSPFRIPATATQGHIRYRFGFRDGMAFNLPQTGEQRVTQIGGAAVVDICDGCGPGLASDPASLAEARRPTEWLQTGDPRIKAIVAPVAGQNISDARKMEILARTARGYLGEIDFAGHFSASETLDRRRGDCTEAAVLLAAFGRAAGIPTRTASGFVYSRERYHGVSNVFMPHSWTLAYVDGKWRSFDAALPEFDTTHIAVTIGDGDMRSMAASGQLASILQWQAMAEVRSRPTSPAR